jgi:hypothetical protein
MPIAIFNTQNFYPFWLTEVNQKNFTLLEKPLDLDIKFRNGFLTGLGGKLPDTYLFGAPNRGLVDSSFTPIIDFGAGDDFYIYNTNAYNYYTYGSASNWGEVFDGASYSNTRIGTFYYGVLIWSESTPDLNRSNAMTYLQDDFPAVYIATYPPNTLLNDSYWRLFKITISEAISPSSFSLNKIGQTLTVDVGADGNFTLSKSGTIPWITLITTTGTNNGTVSFSVSNNGAPSDVYRSGILLLTTPHTVFPIFVEQYTT